MARKILILCGSPRKKGNTNTLVGWVADAARDAGADVEIVDTAWLKYKVNGCIACMGCQKTDKFECVHDDEAAPVLKRIPEADTVVFATPTYFMGPSAQLKLLLDRVFCLVKMNPQDGSMVKAREDQDYAAIATAGGDMNAGLGLVDQTFRGAAAFLAQSYESLLMPQCPHDPAELAADADLRQRATAFGRKLAEA